MKDFKCTKCGSVQKWEAWSGREKTPLKCQKCNKLTMHECVGDHLSEVQKDCPVGG